MTESRTVGADIVALVQHVELNDSGWFDAASRRAVRFLFWIIGKPATVATIFASRKDVGLGELTIKQVQAAVSDLLQGGVLIDTGNEVYKLSEAELLSLDQAVESAGKIEDSVKTKVLIAASIAGADCSGGAGDRLWASFHREFVAPFISEFGARAYELVTGLTTEEKKTQFITEFLARFPGEQQLILEPMILALLDKNSVDCRTFVLRMLNSYFFHSATKLSNETVERAFSNDRRGKSLRFVLDTNFLFSLFELHSNPSNEAVNLLLSTIKKLPKDFNVGLYVLPSTINEFKRTLVAFENQAKVISTSRNVVSAALATKLPGVIQTYLTKVQESGHKLNSKDYFSPFFTNINALLASQSVKILSGEDDRFASDQSTIDDATDQLAFYKRRFINDPRRQRTYETVWHDMVLWHYVSDKRPTICDTVFDAEWMGVTIDFGLMAFDSHKRHNRGIPCMVHPASVVQALQFLIPTDESVERTILALMQMPFLVEPFDLEDERVTQKILGTISRYENVGNMDTETILSVLGSQALRSKIERVQDKDEELELIKDAIIEHAAEMKREADDASSKLAEERNLRIEQAKAQARELETERTLRADQGDRQARDLEDANALRIAAERALKESQRSEEAQRRENFELAEQVRQISAREAARELKGSVRWQNALFGVAIAVTALLIGILVYWKRALEPLAEHYAWAPYGIVATLIALLMLPFYWVVGLLGHITDRFYVRWTRRAAYAVWALYVGLIVAIGYDWVSSVVGKDLPTPASGLEGNGAQPELKETN